MPAGSGNLALPNGDVFFDLVQIGQGCMPREPYVRPVIALLNVLAQNAALHSADTLTVSG